MLVKSIQEYGDVIGPGFSHNAGVRFLYPTFVWGTLNMKA